MASFWPSLMSSGSFSDCLGTMRNKAHHISLIMIAFCYLEPLGVILVQDWLPFTRPGRYQNRTATRIYGNSPGVVRRGPHLSSQTPTAPLSSSFWAGRYFGPGLDVSLVCLTRPYAVTFVGRVCVDSRCSGLHAQPSSPHRHTK